MLKLFRAEVAAEIAAQLEHSDDNAQDSLDRAREKRKKRSEESFGSESMPVATAKTRMQTEMEPRKGVAKIGSAHSSAPKQSSGVGSSEPTPAVKSFSLAY